MLMGIAGDIGSGKTLYATWYTLKFYNDRALYRRAFANFRMTMPSGKPVDLLTKDAFKGLANLSNALVVMDEAYLWLDSRRSASKSNIDVSYIVLQSRKRGFDIVHISQISSSVDLRLRQLSQMMVYADRVCNCRGALDDLNLCTHPRTHGFRYEEVFRSLTHPSVRTRFLSTEKALTVLPYFDTHEIVAFV